MAKEATRVPHEPDASGGYKVRYRPHDGLCWAALSDTYDTYERACMVATALENRGQLTEIVNVDFDYAPLTDNAKGLRPFCKVCGWRKGGVDSWNGVSCKCGHTAQPIELV